MTNAEVRRGRASAFSGPDRGFWIASFRKRRNAPRKPLDSLPSQLWSQPGLQSFVACLEFSCRSGRDTYRIRYAQMHPG